MNRVLHRCWDGDDVVYVARVPTAKRIMSINVNLGTRLPAHVTSMGRVLLAGLSPQDLERFYRIDLAVKSLYRAHSHGSRRAENGDPPNGCTGLGDC